MIERQIGITTKDGRMNTFICHPERSRPYPMIIFFMDAPGIREELRDMVRRLATVGYYVVLPNLYYRFNVEELGPHIGEAYTATREKVMKLKDTLTMEMVMEDADDLIAFASRDDAASRGPMGCVGYCMSGRYSINTAVRHGAQIRAAASIYGTDLVSDQPDSPHLALQRTDARLYFACAENDQYAPAEVIEKLRSELAQRGVNAEVEIYPALNTASPFPRAPHITKPRQSGTGNVCSRWFARCPEAQKKGLAWKASPQSLEEPVTEYDRYFSHHKTSTLRWPKRRRPLTASDPYRTPGHS